MWESPIYKIVKKRQNTAGKTTKEVITIDVTGSAPTMADPGDYLEGVFAALTKGKNPKDTVILDFGAAKLRNTLYLLKKGFQVRAVEFPELVQRMQQAKTNWAAAEKYSNFRKVVFPKDFYNLKEKVDIALYLNVLNVMPIPFERLAALALCRTKMKDDGLLYWLNWKPASSDPQKYGGKNTLNDGWFVGKGRDKKTFHVEWSREEAFETLIATGYSPCEDVEIESSSSQSYVFRADQPILLSELLRLAEIAKGGLKRDPNQELPEYVKLSFLKLYLDELKTIKAGKDSAIKYHRIATRLLAGIFVTQLKNPVNESPINDGLGSVDVRFQNRNEPGFFKNAKEMHDIKCPSVIVECKNYSGELDNPVFDQIAGRMDNPARGMLGIIACREIANRDKVVKRAQAKTPAGKYILVLEDKDFEKLVKLKINDGDETVNDFMERRLNEVIN